MKEELLSIIEKYNFLGVKDQLDYDKFYLYSIITHSTAIEGSTVTEIENQLLFDEGISANKPIKEQLADYEKSTQFNQNDTLKVQNDTLNDTLNLTGKEKTVLNLIKSDLNIKTNEIVLKTGFSRPTVMRAIKTLKEKDQLERLDSKKSGSWKVNK